MDKIFEITAKEVTIQVKDERTGEQYSRTLPVIFDHCPAFSRKYHLHLPKCRFPGKLQKI